MNPNEKILPQILHGVFDLDLEGIHFVAVESVHGKTAIVDRQISKTYWEAVALGSFMREVCKRCPVASQCLPQFSYIEEFPQLDHLTMETNIIVHGDMVNNQQCEYSNGAYVRKPDLDAFLTNL